MQRTLLALGLLVPLLATAEVYRWKDEHGNWQFGDRAPEAQHESMELRAPQKLGQDERVRDIHERTLRLRESEQAEERERLARAKAEREHRLRQIEPQCREARQRLRRLHRPFVYVDDEGNQRGATASEVLADIAETQEWIQENCE